MKKRALILLVLLLLALSACGSNERDSSASDRPAIRLKLDGQTYDGSLYSYCWPESETNLVCDVNADALDNPAAVTVPPGSEMRFVVTGNHGEPQRFTAIMLDLPGSTATELGPGTEVAFVSGMSTGTQRVRVDVQFADIKGKAAYVSYVFALNYEGAAVAAQTTPVETAEVVPTVEVTAPPTPTATFEPTTPPTLAPTATTPPQASPTTFTPPRAEALGEQTNLRTAPDDEAPVMGQIEPGTLYPVVGESGEWYLIEFSGSPNGMAWVSKDVVRLTGDVAAIEMLKPDELPTVDAAAIAALPTEEAAVETLEATEETLEATLEVPQPTAEILEASPTAEAGPSPEPTQVPRLTAVPTTLPMSPAPTITTIPTKAPSATPVPASPTPTTPAAPTATPTAAASPTAVATAAVTETAPEMGGEVPTLTLKFAGQKYLPLGYEYCERQTAGQIVCVKLPADAPTQRLNLLRGAAAQLQIGDARPSEVRIEYLSDTGLPTGQPETVRGDNTILFTITPEAGSYILSLHVTWPDKTATYFFRVTISG